MKFGTTFIVFRKDFKLILDAIAKNYSVLPKANYFTSQPKTHDFNKIFVNIEERNTINEHEISEETKYLGDKSE